MLPPFYITSKNPPGSVWLPLLTPRIDRLPEGKAPALNRSLIASVPLTSAAPCRRPWSCHALQAVQR